MVKHRKSDEEFIEQLAHIPAMGDRVRLAGLNQANAIFAAKEHRLKRELARNEARSGEDDDSQLKALGKRLQIQQMQTKRVRVEIERAEIPVPERRQDAFILHGRVVDADRKGQSDLTVSIIDKAGEPLDYVCTDERGYFKFEMLLKKERKPMEKLFLQVSDEEKAVLFRGKEGHEVERGRIVYREIVLSGERMEPCPPPPESEMVSVPNLVGQKEADAKAMIEKSGLMVGSVEKSDDSEGGVVIDQNPQAERELPQGSSVDLKFGKKHKSRIQWMESSNR